VLKLAIGLAVAVIAAVVGVRAATGSSAPERDSRGTVTIGVDSDDVLPDVVARLRAAGIAVEEFSLHLPSLDEVFFTLTGTRSAGDARESSEVAA